MQNWNNGPDEKLRRTRKRCFSKCTDCRRDHKRCLPVEREWSNRIKEKCMRCRKKGHPCGPNVRLPSRQNHEVDLPSKISVEVLQKDTFRKSVEERSWTDVTSSTTSTVNSRISTPNSSYRSMAQTSLGVSSHAGERSLLQYYLSQESETDSGCDEPLPLVQEARKSLSNVGTYLELHQVLQDRMKAVVNANARIGPLDSFKDTEMALSLYESAVKQEVCSKMKYALMIARQSQVAGPEKELLLSRLDSLVRRFLQTLGNSVFNEENDEKLLIGGLKNLQSSIVKELSSLHESQGNRFEASHLRRSCHAANVSQTPDKAVEIPADNEQEREAFQDASSRMWKTLKSLKCVPYKYKRLLLEPTHDDPEAETPRGRFPATHLALMEGKLLSSEIHDQASSGHLSIDLIGRTVLHVAAESGNVEVAKMLLRQSPSLVSIAKRDIFSLTPLCIAAYQGNLELCQLLIEKGADTQIRDIVSRNLLAIACRAGSISIVEHMLSSKTSSIDRRGMCSPLHEALSGGHEKIAQMLLDHSDNLQQWQTPASAMAFGQGFMSLGRRLKKLEEQSQAQGHHLLSHISDISFEKWLDDREEERFSNATAWTILLGGRSEAVTWSGSKDSLPSSDSFQADATVYLSPENSATLPPTFTCFSEEDLDNHFAGYDVREWHSNLASSIAGDMSDCSALTTFSIRSMSSAGHGGFEMVDLPSPLVVNDEMSGLV